MKRGPRNVVTDVDFVAKAHEGWSVPPAWVLSLAQACAASSQAAVGRRLGLSGALISAVLGGTYAARGGDMKRVEEIVRGALMGSTLVCPVMGEIGTDRCHKEQREPFRATSAFRVRLFQMCRRCPNRHTKEESHA